MPGPELSRRALLTGGAGLGLLTLAGCSTAPAAPGQLRLATGPEGGAYREVGAALARLWNREWGEGVVEPVSTDAAVENLQLLQGGEVELALVNVDVAEAAAGSLRALVRVFDSVMHVLVPSESSARTIEDLAGLRVCTGLPGSGSRFTTTRILELADIEVEEVALAQAHAVVEMSEGRIDAWMSLSAMPTPAVETLLSERGRFRFVELGVHSELLAAYPGVYVDTTISPSIYPDAEPVRALGVPTVLVVRDDFPDDLAHFLTGVTMGGVEELAGARRELWQIDQRTAVATTPIPLHDGAAQWYREHKP